MKTKNSLKYYDLETNSISNIDFGGEVKYLFVQQNNLCLVFEGDGKIYISDLLGGNMELVFDRSDLGFRPYNSVGDYLIGEIPLICEIMPGGTYALNIKTGELKAIPAIN